LFKRNYEQFAGQGEPRLAASALDSDASGCREVNLSHLDKIIQENRRKRKRKQGLIFRFSPLE
jgi:hypothetical protein